MGLHPDFPLFPLGPADRPDRLRWAKKVRGKLVYFGKVQGDEKGQAALERWLEQKDDLLAGRTPRAKRGGLTLAELCNRFLSGKRADLGRGALSATTFLAYAKTGSMLVETLGGNTEVAGLGPEDFDKLFAVLAAKHGVAALGREVTTTRSFFRFAYDYDLIDRPPKFGPRFKAPSKADKRKHKARQQHAHGSRTFTAEELRRILEAASPQLRAMTLLGINGGLGNYDCSSLTQSALDLRAGWLDYPRPKTGINRRIPLWPETVEALKAVLASRRKPKDKAHENLVFITQCGQPWVWYRVVETEGADGKIDISGGSKDSVAKMFITLLKRLGIKRRGLSFYSLRHTFETQAGDAKDQVAVDAVMGHVDGSMAAEYRGKIEDARLVAVVNHVRQWLFGKAVAHA